MASFPWPGCIVLCTIPYCDFDENQPYILFQTIEEIDREEDRERDRERDFVLNEQNGYEAEWTEIDCIELGIT